MGTKNKLYYIVNLDFGCPPYFSLHSEEIHNINYWNTNFLDMKNLNKLVLRHDFKNDNIENFDIQKVHIKLWNQFHEHCLELQKNNKNNLPNIFYNKKRNLYFSDITTLKLFKSVFSDFEVEVIISYSNIFDMLYNYYSQYQALYKQESNRSIKKRKVIHKNITTYFYHEEEYIESIKEALINFKLVFGEKAIYIDLDKLKYNNIDYYSLLCSKFNLKNKNSKRLKKQSSKKGNLLRDFSQSQLLKIENIINQFDFFKKFKFIKDNNSIIDIYEYYEI